MADGALIVAELAWLPSLGLNLQVRLDGLSWIFAFLVLATVFLCGGVLLGVEIAASRVLAPYFGNSLFVWGALIGVVGLLLPVVAAGLWPARALAPSHAAARAWVDMTTRGRCERAVRVGDTLARVPEQPSEACGQPLRTLEQGGRP